MSPEIIRIFILILVILVIGRVLFAAGRKMLSFIVSIGFSFFFFVKYLWPYVETVLLN